MLSGELAGLLASALWAVSSSLFSRAAASAGALNLLKCAVAAAAFGAALPLARAVRGELLEGLGAREALLLLSSSLIGIVVGDTLYLRSLLALGARRALLLTTLTPPFGALLGIAYLGERLTLPLAGGILLTTAGVAWVLHERGAAAEAAPASPWVARRDSPGLGVALGIAAALCQALGLALAREPLQRVNALDASALRLGAAAILFLLYGASTGRLAAWTAAVLHDGMPWRLVIASLLGTVGGIYLSLVAAQRSPLAVAATLTSLAPVLVLPIARFALRQRVSPRAVLGAGASLAGVVWIFLRGGSS